MTGALHPRSIGESTEICSARRQPTASPALPAPKMLFYSHDTFGVGNIRRTLLLSQTLADDYPRASMLVVTGSPMIRLAIG